MVICGETRAKLRKIYKRCRLCHSKEQLEFHHMIPKAKNIKWNQMPLCHKCHVRYHDYYHSAVAQRVKKAIDAFKQQMSNNLAINGPKEPTVHKVPQIIFSKFLVLKKEIVQDFARLEKELTAKIKEGVK